jgi:Protein of unknown function (DUF992)
MKFRLSCLTAAAAALMLAAAMPAAQAQVEVGGMNCRSPGGVGFLVGAVLNFQCVFVPSYGGPPHLYYGVVRRVGLDLGFTQGVSMGWAVFAPTGYIRPGDLAGAYGGVQAGASFGVGLGANALVGGSGNTFALQPVSGQAQAGLNVSAGLAGFELVPASYFAGRRLRHRHAYAHAYASARSHRHRRHH